MENTLIEILTQIPALADVDTDDLAHVTKNVKIKKFAKDAIVIKQGDKGDNFYVIKSGKIEVIKENNGVQKQFAVLYPDNFFGEMALINEAPRNATIRCLEPTELYVFNKQDFYDLLYL